jgi:hypothetical protein
MVSVVDLDFLDWTSLEHSHKALDLIMVYQKDRLLYRDQEDI